MQIVIVKFQFKACCYIGFQKNSRKGLSSRPSTKKLILIYPDWPWITVKFLDKVVSQVLNQSLLHPSLTQHLQGLACWPLFTASIFDTTTQLYGVGREILAIYYDQCFISPKNMAKWQWNCYPMREKDLLGHPFSKLFPDFCPSTTEEEKSFSKYYFHSEESFLWRCGFQDHFL